jgi:hypothetical protein
VSVKTGGRSYPAGPTQDPLADWANLIRAEYCEMAGLSLTLNQVERLWQLDRPTASALLQSLIADGFLRCTEKGAFIRADLGPPDSDGSRL